jgi:hypothetical protein
MHPEEEEMKRVNYSRFREVSVMDVVEKRMNTFIA